jgi:hypothetical protein
MTALLLLLLLWVMLLEMQQGSRNSRLLCAVRSTWHSAQARDPWTACRNSSRAYRHSQQLQRMTLQQHLTRQARELQQLQQLLLRAVPFAEA